MTYRPNRLISLTIAAFLCTFHGAAATANDDDEFVTYQVVSGDNLHNLAEKYMVGPQSVEVVRRLNNVNRPTLMQIGKKLRIPREQLRSAPVVLRVQSVSGPVMLISNGKRENASRGAVLRQGMEIETGRKGFVALSGSAGSHVTLPSRSHAKLRSAKRYIINDALDVDLEILKGRSSIRAPKLRRQERFRTRTPIAVSAVRGTEFRVGFDSETSLATTEVIEGKVAISNSADSALAPEGFGVATNTEGLNPPEALLAAPDMLDPTRLQTGELIEFSIAPAADAKAYRVQIGSDAGFTKILDETVTEDVSASFTDLPNGRYFVRTRAIADSGLEGLSQAHSFKRHRVGVTASADPLANGCKFSWAGQGDGKTVYGFQMWTVDAPDMLIIDEVGMPETSLILTNIDSGHYKWRVGAMQMTPEGLVKVWSEPQDFTASE